MCSVSGPDVCLSVGEELFQIEEIILDYMKN